LNHAKKKVQSESDYMPSRASPSGFSIPYNFSTSLTLVLEG